MSKRRSRYRYPRDRPVAYRSSQLLSQITGHEEFWVEGRIISDDYIKSLGLLELYEIRKSAIHLAKITRLKSNRRFFSQESERLMRIIDKRIELEDQKMLDGGG